MDRLRAAIQFKDAQRDQQGFGRHVVIDDLHGFEAARRAAAGEVADLDFRLGINGDSQRIGVGCRFGTGVLDVLENGIRFGNFFSGLVLRTRRRR